MCDALSRLLEDKPLGRITITDICAGANMTVGGFYFHFKSQEELLQAVVAEHLHALAQAWDEALEADGMTGAVSSLCGVFLEAYSTRNGVSRAYQQLLLTRPEYVEGWRSLMQTRRAQLARIIAAERPAASPEHALFLSHAAITLITSMLNVAYVFSDKAAAPPSKDAVLQELRRACLRLLGACEDGPGAEARGVGS